MVTFQAICKQAASMNTCFNLTVSCCWAAACRDPNMQVEVGAGVMLLPQA